MIAHFDENGKIKPIRFRIEEDGVYHVIKIEKILNTELENYVEIGYGYLLVMFYQMGLQKFVRLNLTSRIVVGYSTKYKGDGNS